VNLSYLLVCRYCVEILRFSSAKDRLDFVRQHVHETEHDRWWTDIGDLEDDEVKMSLVVCDKFYLTLEDLERDNRVVP
jgi:hypothetical protein